MYTYDENDPNRIAGHNGRTIVIAVLVILGVLLAFVAVVTREDEPLQQGATQRSSSFREVRNDCGACGKPGVVGGWESADGNMLIFADTGNFNALMSDGTRLSGTYERQPGELCLVALGSRTCFSYQQKTDAMKLDEAVYIRR